MAKLSNEVLSDLKKAFEEYDLNSDGKIDKTEFMNLFNKQGLDFTEKELKGFFYMIEPDEKGSIDFNGFINFYQNGFDLNFETFAKNVFKDLDANNDGFVSFDEFKQVIDIIPDVTNDLEELKADFNRADKNSDGKLSLKEFIDVLYKTNKTE